MIFTHTYIYTYFFFFKDEFRRWFLARVRVMLAPGSNPFYSLDTQTTSPPSPSSPTCINGHTSHPSAGSPAQELISRFGDYQPTQVMNQHGNCSLPTDFLTCDSCNSVVFIYYNFSISPRSAILPSIVQSIIGTMRCRTLMF